MFLEKIKALPIILGSQSPRRKELLKSMDLDFEVLVKSIDESLPQDIKAEYAAEYVTLQKLKAFNTIEFRHNLVITADTVVVDHQGSILGKPTDVQNAKEVLAILSGNTHHVYTAVGLYYQEQIWSFTCATEVRFNTLTQNEIDYYINKYQPFDKAGSYGIQEWIGRIGVDSISGSYENVMGLPTSRLYKELVEIEKGL